MHVLLHPILPSYNWPSSPPGTHSEGSGNTLLCILSYEKTGHKGGNVSEVSLNLKCLVLATPFKWGYKPGI